MIDEKTRLIMKTLTVLYVEDEAGIREQMIVTLQRKFGQVYIARDGQEGLELFRTKNPDFVITDIKMPKMDGLQMVEAIRQKNGSIPIIIVTAFSDLENLSKSIELGVDRFLPKPTTKTELDKVLLKATQLIVKQAEIEDQNRIIQTILGWNPYFSIISSETRVDHVTADFIKTYGFSDKDLFLQELHKLDWSKIGEDSERIQFKVKTLNELFAEISEAREDQYFVSLCSAASPQEVLYEVKGKYFEATKLYLISFFKVENIPWNQPT